MATPQQPGARQGGTASRHLSRAERRPVDLKQRVAEALALQRSGQHAKAAEAYRAVIEIDPRHRMAHKIGRAHV